ncbi:hypothetical protein BVX98_07600 [bacterium F11]|nr:hypothetical protein BVX98_07600 [bacterium F11]
MPLKPPKGMIDETDPRVAPFGHPAPPWMVNYADLMTELVCFYLILYSLSSALSKPLQGARDEIKETMAQHEVAGDAEITKDGLVITLQEAGYHVFFKSGSADLSDSMKKILDEMSSTFVGLAEKDHEIIVEGHTDNVPIKTPRYASNWELSTSRATNVVKYLLREHDYPANQIGAIGYGENRILPREQEEDLDSWHARNRRVVFIVKNPPPNLSSKDEDG